MTTPVDVRTPGRRRRGRRTAGTSPTAGTRRTPSPVADPPRDGRLVRPAGGGPEGGASMTRLRWAAAFYGGFLFTPVGMAAAVWLEP